MGRKKVQRSVGGVWQLARGQHGVVTRRQLLELGLSRNAITHRLARGRLHTLWRGVYAVGRSEVSREGRWLAAVFACGEGALLSHRSAAELWGILDRSGPAVDVSVPARRAPRRPGIGVRRRTVPLEADRSLCAGVPVTSPAATLIDLAADRDPRLEAGVNAADRLRLIDPEALRAEIDRRPHRPGATRLRLLLDRDTFSPTDSALERRFLTIVEAAGLPLPRTQVELNGFRVDFYWPDLGLVVETDGLRYHRTAQQQAKDLRRDQTQATAGLRTLRFAAAQVFHEPATVRRILLATVGHSDPEA